MVKQDMFLNNNQRLWEWMKRKRSFSSIDLARYALTFYYLRAGRTAREWCQGEHPRLRRLDRQEKLFKGLVKPENSMLAFYEVINGHK